MSKAEDHDKRTMEIRGIMAGNVNLEAFLTKVICDKHNIDYSNMNDEQDSLLLKEGWEIAKKIEKQERRKHTSFSDEEIHSRVMTAAKAMLKASRITGHGGIQ